jgi:hypothetical protein
MGTSSPIFKRAFTDVGYHCLLASYLKKKRASQVSPKQREIQNSNSGSSGKQPPVELGDSNFGLRKRCECKLTKQNQSPLSNNSVVDPGAEGVCAQDL